MRTWFGTLFLSIHIVRWVPLGTATKNARNATMDVVGGLVSDCCSGGLAPTRDRRFCTASHGIHGRRRVPFLAPVLRTLGEQAESCQQGSRKAPRLNVRAAEGDRAQRWAATVGGGRPCARAVDLLCVLKGK